MTNGYKELLEDEPIIPDPTCPHIDKAQQYLEELYVRQATFKLCEADDCISYY